MAHIVLLALAAAVFPLLIACVAIILSRPQPRRLLLAFFVGGVIVSVTAGVVLLATFNDHSAVLGNTASHPSPGTSIVAGLVALPCLPSERSRAADTAASKRSG
jgi:Sap, sulfolipid-1-addressing protein